MRFRDRRDAGRRLAQALEGVPVDHPLVIGLPRGGVPVAAEVAAALGAPLDVLVVRKIGAPSQPEFAVGAIARGVEHLDHDTLAMLRLRPEDLAPVIAEERAELERRERRYRGNRPPLDVRGRDVVVVDDGIATGETAAAALQVLRAAGARRLVLAVPTGGAGCRARMAPFADEVICLDCSPAFRAVGEAYDDFSPTSDEEVLGCLGDAAG